MAAPISNDPPTAWQQAEAIMTALGETEHISHVQISRAIEALGLDVVEAVVMEARTVEVNGVSGSPRAGGPLLRQDGERRTIGEIFFYMLRDRCTPQQRTRIF